MICTAKPLNAQLEKHVKPFFPVEMWFAIKAEDKTMHKVIVAISKQPNMNFTQAACYVAFFPESDILHASDSLSLETQRKIKNAVLIINGT